MIISNSSFVLARKLLTSSSIALALFISGFGEVSALAEDIPLVELPCEQDPNSNCAPNDLVTNSVPNQPLSADNGALAQSTDTEGATDSAELAELKEEAALAKERQAIAEAKLAEIKAKQAEIDAIIPESKVVPLMGDIKGSELLKHENIIIGYQELELITDGIAKNIIAQVPANSTILINDSSSIAKMNLYHLFKQQLDFLNQTYDNEIEFMKKAKSDNSSGSTKGASAQSIQAVLNAPRIGTSFVKQIAEFTSLFNQDQTFVNLSINISDKAFVSQLNQAFKKNNRDDIVILNPSEHGMNLLEYNKILSDLNNLSQKRLNANKAAAELSFASDDNTSLFVARVDKINMALDAILTRLVTVDSVSTKPIMQLLVEGSMTSKALNQPHTHLFDYELQTEGSVRKRKNIFTGTSIKRATSVLVDYQVYNQQSEMTDSNVLYRISPYIKRDEIENNMGE